MTLQELLQQAGISAGVVETPEPPAAITIDPTPLDQFRFVAEELRTQTAATVGVDHPQYYQISSTIDFLLSDDPEEQAERLSTAIAIVCGMCAISEEFDESIMKATEFLISDLVPKAVAKGLL